MQELLEKKNTDTADDGVRVFFQELNHCPRLTPTETLELAKACAAGLSEKCNNHSGEGHNGRCKDYRDNTCGINAERNM